MPRRDAQGRDTPLRSGRGGRHGGGGDGGREWGREGDRSHPHSLWPLTDRKRTQRKRCLIDRDIWGTLRLLGFSITVFRLDTEPSSVCKERAEKTDFCSFLSSRWPTNPIAADAFHPAKASGFICIPRVRIRHECIKKTIRFCSP